MKKMILIIPLILFSELIFSQTIIKMGRKGGVSVVPCKVNGLSLSFIFDTGASDVTISLTEASFMLKNAYLKEEDIIGTANYSNANGEISEGIVINLKEIEIAGLKLYNVRASIVKNLDAPLLLGQTALSKLGKIEIDLNSNTLIINKNLVNNTKISNTQNNTSSHKNTNNKAFKHLKIGTNEWTTENLDVTTFRNGDNLFFAKTKEEWEYVEYNNLPAYCYYDFDINLNYKYGKYYNFFAVNDKRGLAPEGWHIPSLKEFERLFASFGGKKDAGKKLKSVEAWIYNEDKNRTGNGNNLSGFNAKPCGSINNIRYSQDPYTKENCHGLGIVAEFWTSDYDEKHDWSTYIYFTFYDNSANFLFREPGFGMPIRCIKNY